MYNEIGPGLTQPSSNKPSCIPKSCTRVQLVEESRSVQVEAQGSAVSITGEVRSLTYSKSSGISGYKQALPVAVIEKPVENSAVNPYARTIVQSINLQMQRDVGDGATKEALQSRLEAGLAGFKQGYGEAMDQLGALSEFSPEIRAEIEQTRAQVMQGIQDIADQLGLDVSKLIDDESMKATAPLPEPAASPSKDGATAGSSVLARQKVGTRILNSVTRDLKTLEQYTEVKKSDTYGRKGGAHGVSKNADVYGYQVSEQRQLAFNLTTRDGDVVTLKMDAGKYGRSDLSQGALSLQGEQSSQFEFSVEGDLDEKELEAIGHLLGQVGDISELFFSDDLDGAFMFAANIQVDDSEIGAFDFNLRKEVTETAVVGVESKSASPNNGLMGLFSDLKDKVDFAGGVAEQMNQPRSLVADLVDWVAQQTHPRHAFTPYVGPMVRTML